MAQEDIDFNWQNKHKTLKEFYKNEYSPEYYSFSKYEMEIDPMEPFEEIEAYDDNRRQIEFLKCAASFSYFCHKYVKIAHPKRGLLPFILYKYQKRVVKEYEKHRFNILSKFRQGGLTTVTVLWCMWCCMFKLDETIMVLSKSDREAIAAGEIVKRALLELPAWMKPEMDKNNDHQKLFSETGCKLFFYTPEAARGRSITYLVLDEAAFIPQMEKHWKAMFPTISTGGHCICISTVNGVGNWYYDIFMGAKKGENDFEIIELDYWEHPEYNDPDWVKATRAQLGEKGWLQEVMRDFLGAGDSYIPAEIINDLDQITREIDPLRMLFPKWNNLDEAREQRVLDMESWVRGALHIWREPVDGREYIIGVDVAGGMGEENDNSCFEVIDAVTCEQVAEFYSNLIPPYNFADLGDGRQDLQHGSGGGRRQRRLRHVGHREAAPRLLLREHVRDDAGLSLCSPPRHQDDTLQPTEVPRSLADAAHQPQYGDPLKTVRQGTQGLHLESSDEESRSHQGLPRRCHYGDVSGAVRPRVTEPPESGGSGESDGGVQRDVQGRDL